MDTEGRRTFNFVSRVTYTRYYETNVPQYWEYSTNEPCRVQDIYGNQPAKGMSPVIMP